MDKHILKEQVNKIPWFKISNILINNYQYILKFQGRHIDNHKIEQKWNFLVLNMGLLITYCFTLHYIAYV